MRSRAANGPTHANSRPMRRNSIALWCACLLLVGCDAILGPTTTGTGTETTKPTANLTIGTEEAAGISIAVPMTLEAVTAAAPGFYVAEGRERAGGNVLHVFTLSTDDGDMFRLYPTVDGARISAIAALSPQVRGPTDETVTVSTYYQAPHAEVAYCEARSVGATAGFACSAYARGRLWRVYRLPRGYDGPSAPFDAIDPDAATDATLVELRWIAPGPG